MDRIEAMRRGRRLAYLKRCVTAQELLSKHESPTSIRKRVFEKYIAPELGCCYATFNNMLNVVNPKKEIELLTQKKLKKCLD